MTTAQVSEKGQVTLPASARRNLGIAPGSKVEIEVRENELVIRPIKSIREVRGIFRDAAKGKSGEWETVRSRAEEIVAKEVADEGRR